MTDPWRAKRVFFVADRIVATSRLTTEQYGALSRLEDDYWRNGPLPEGDIVLSRIVGLHVGAWRRIREPVLAFFRLENGRLVSDRLDANLLDAKSRWETRVANSAKGGEARKRKPEPSRTATRTEAGTKPDGYPDGSQPDSRNQAQSKSRTTTTNCGTALSAGADGDPPAAVETLPAVRDDTRDDVNAWNSFAARCGWPQCRKLGASRKRKLLARKRDPDWNLPAILAAAEQSAGLRGAQWFGLDWLIANDANYLKVIEGKYRRAFDEKSARVDPVEVGNRKVIEKWSSEIHGERNGSKRNADLPVLPMEDQPGGPADSAPVLGWDEGPE